MSLILELFPLVAFLGAFYLRDLYFATGTLMVAMLVMLAGDYLLLRRLPRMHLLSTALVVVFGTATLVLRDDRFIKWKPTIFLWIVAIAFLVSGFIGRQPLVARFLQPALESVGTISLATWKRLNWLWVVFYGVLGGVNLYVAYHTSQKFWVNFKVIGITGATLVFVLAQAMWLGSRVKQSEPDAP